MTDTNVRHKFFKSGTVAFDLRYDHRFKSDVIEVTLADGPNEKKKVIFIPRVSPSDGTVLISAATDSGEIF